MKPLEIRKLAGAPEVRDAADGSPGNKLAGYAAKFGVDSCILRDPSVEDGRPFVERIDPRAFDRTLDQMPDVRALYNHDTGAVLGRTKSGTLRISVDAEGLAFEDDLPDTIDGQRARELVRRGDIDGCSFGFVVVEDLIEDLGPDVPMIRTLLDVDLHEISIAVAFPAYEATQVAIRERTTRKTHRATTAGPTPRLDRARRALMLETD